MDAKTLCVKRLRQSVGPIVEEPSIRGPFRFGLVSQAKSAGAAFFSKVLGSGYNFALRSLAGAFGAFYSLPIDLVKADTLSISMCAQGVGVYTCNPMSWL